MEHTAPYSMYNVDHLDTTQPQILHGIQVNHDHTFPTTDSVGQVNDHGWSAVETANGTGDSEFGQVTELDLDAGLASMNLKNDGAAVPERTQPATVRTSLDPPYIVDSSASAGAAFDACTALKNELDAALNAYRQSREAMLWHAANVCRVNLEYIRALQAMNRVQG